MEETGSGLEFTRERDDRPRPDGRRDTDASGQRWNVERPEKSRVLVAIPCYNEEVAIAGLVLRAKDHADEVIVIDDDSDDQTREMARRAGAKVLSNDRNRGKGYSVKRAFRYAERAGVDALVLMDGDGQHDPSEIPQLVEPILNPRRNGDTKDIALGFRVGEMTEMPAWRRVGKRVLDYATATATGSGEMLTDSQCGYRAFGPDAIEQMAEKLEGDDFGVESEQLMIARETGLEYENVKVHCRYDGIENKSTKDPVSHAMGVIENLIQMVTQRRPLLFMGVPAVLLLVAGGGLGIYTLQYWTWTDYFSMPYALTSATLILLGMLGLMTSLILNVVGRFEDKVEDTVDRAVTEPPVEAR